MTDLLATFATHFVHRLRQLDRRIALSVAHSAETTPARILLIQLRKQTQVRACHLLTYLAFPCENYRRMEALEACLAIEETLDGDYPPVAFIALVEFIITRYTNREVSR